MGRTGTSCFAVICDSAFSEKGSLKIAKVCAISKKCDDIGQAWLLVLIIMDGYDWVVGWVTNDGALRSELRKVDLARDQVDLAKAMIIDCYSIIVGLRAVRSGRIPKI
jgi:hypothetical protein